MNNSSKKIEALIGSVRPTETSVTSGKVLFEAGRMEGAQDQRSRQHRTLRLWQLASACSLLIACGSILTTWSPPEPPKIAESSAKETSATKEIETSGPKRERKTTASDYREGRLAKMFTSPWGRSAVVQRDLILNGGIAGLPAIQSPGVATESLVDNRVLIDKLLAEERW